MTAPTEHDKFHNVEEKKKKGILLSVGIKKKARQLTKRHLHLQGVIQLFNFPFFSCFAVVLLLVQMSQTHH